MNTISATVVFTLLPQAFAPRDHVAAFTFRDSADRFPPKGAAQLDSGASATCQK